MDTNFNSVQKNREFFACMVGYTELVNTLTAMIPMGRTRKASLQCHQTHGVDTGQMSISCENFRYCVNLGSLLNSGNNVPVIVKKYGFK